MRLAPRHGVGTTLALCVAALLCLAGCGGTGATPPTVTETLSSSGQAQLPPPTSGQVSSAQPSAGTPSTSGVPAGPGVTPDPALVAPSTSTAKTAQQTITDTFHTFTYLLSGLDDNLNSAWLQPLADVTTERLAQAVTRQASAMLHAHEHGVGTLEGQNLTVKITGASTAAIAECENYADFYLADDGTQSPDSGIVRGNFVGTAQLVKIRGRWYVDVYATTQTACAWKGTG